MGRITMRQCYFRKKQAITLIELLIVILLIILVFAGGVVATITLLQFLNSERAESAATENLVNTLEWIRKDAMIAFEADVSTPNEITFLRYYTGAAGGTQIASTRYYVISGTNNLFRDDSFPGSTTLITDMIDSTSQPIFQTPTPDANYLRAGIWISDPAMQTLAHSWLGIVLRCRGSGTN